MSDETGTETTRSDVPGVDDSLFSEAADAPAATADEQNAAEETEQDGEAPAAAGEPDADGESGQDSGPAEEQADAVEGAPANELKVVVSIRGARATIGVQQPSSDPHIESFDDLNLPALTQEVPAVVDRARAMWEESPKHPTYERPAPPARSRNRRHQGAVQGAKEAPETETVQAQQQTLRLF